MAQVPTPRVSATLSRPPARRIRQNSSRVIRSRQLELITYCIGPTAASAAFRTATAAGEKALPITRSGSDPLPRNACKTSKPEKGSFRQRTSSMSRNRIGRRSWLGNSATPHAPWCDSSGGNSSICPMVHRSGRSSNRSTGRRQARSQVARRRSFALHSQLKPTPPESGREESAKDAVTPSPPISDLRSR